MAQRKRLPRWTGGRRHSAFRCHHCRWGCLRRNDFGQTLQKGPTRREGATGDQQDGRDPIPSGSCQPVSQYHDKECDKSDLPVCGGVRVMMPSRHHPGIPICLVVFALLLSGCAGTKSSPKPVVTEAPPSTHVEPPPPVQAELAS